MGIPYRMASAEARKMSANFLRIFVHLLAAHHEDLALVGERATRPHRERPVPALMAMACPPRPPLQDAPLWGASSGTRVGLLDCWGAGSRDACDGTPVLAHVLAVSGIVRSPLQHDFGDTVCAR